jgi:phosphatidate cytidylyltransferase
VEGFIGGVVGAVVLSLIYAYVIKKEVFLYVVAALLGSLISVVGDLIASAFKRHYEIKDYGKIIPGHGGVLDRYDSVAFTAPFVYYAIVLIRMI